jgi:WD40 repeat protein
VIDDVWDRGQLAPFRIGGRACTRLVTTRVPDSLPAGAARLRVDALPPDQARAMVTDGLASVPAGTADRLVVAGRHCPVLLNAINGGLHRRVERGQRIDEAATDVLERLATAGPTALDPRRPTDRTGVGPTVEASAALLDPGDQERWTELGIFPEDIDIPQALLELLWPGRPVARLCEDLEALGLVADYRLDPPGPRLVLHDLVREYLRWRHRPDERAAVHRRLVEAATGLLPAVDPELTGRSPTPWWMLPDDAVHLLRWLPYHLGKAGMTTERLALVCDLRWVEAKIRHDGSVTQVLADLAVLHDPTAAALAAVLRRSAPLLGPIDPPGALGATLASRLHGVDGLDEVLDRYRTGLARPYLEPWWPLPDQIDDDDPAALSAGMNGCTFSPDGSLLALAGDDGATRLWSLRTHQVTRVLQGHTGGVRDSAFSRDGSLLATVSQDGTVRFARVDDGTTVRVLALADGSAPGIRRVVGGCFSPDDTRFAIGGGDGRVRIWDLDTGVAATVLDGHPTGVRQCAFSPDGTLLATAGADRAVRLWRTADGTLQAVLTGHDGEVNDCEFSPDGMLLASAGLDHTVRLWRVPDGALEAVLRDHGSRVYSCTFSPDGTLLASTGVGSVRLWSVADHSVRARLDGHRAAVGGCAFSPDGSLLATASTDQMVRLWNVADGSGTEIQIGAGRGAGGCAFSPDGRLVAGTGLDGSVTLRRLDDGGLHARLQGPPGYSRACAFSPDGRVLATADNGGRVHLWPLASGAEPRVVALHEDWVTSCAFSPDGSLLVTASHDTTGTLADAADGSVVAVLRGHTDQVNSGAFSPDGSLAASASDDHKVRLWRVPGGGDAGTLSGHDDQVNGVAFAPDGRRLATASDDRTVRLWSVPDGRELAVLRGHTYKAHACAYSPDGTTLASIDTDGSIRLWDAATGQPVGALRVTGRLISLAWHPGGTHLCAAGGAGLFVFRYVR